MVYKSLVHRRSIRRFKPEKVQKSLTDQLIRAALLSPSSRNIRPWHFVWVDDRALIASLSQAKPHGAAFLAQAPLAVVVAADTSKSDVWVEDTAIASTVLLLMAEELGLGACWCQIRNRFHHGSHTADDYVKDLLKLPDAFSVESIIGFGYPDEQIPPYDDTALNFDKVSHNRYSPPVKPLK